MDEILDFFLGMTAFWKNKLGIKGQKYGFEIHSNGLGRGEKEGKKKVSHEV